MEEFPIPILGRDDTQFDKFIRMRRDASGRVL
jgi:hypothetical protein